VRQQRAQGIQAQSAGDAQQQGQPQAIADQPGDAGRVTAAMANGDQAADGRDHPRAEDREDEVAGSAQRATGQLLRAEHGHHQRVGEDHQRVGQLRRDQRAGQAHQRTQLLTKGIFHDE